MTENDYQRFFEKSERKKYPPPEGCRACGGPYPNCCDDFRFSMIETDPNDINGVEKGGRRYVQGFR